MDAEMPIDRNSRLNAERREIILDSARFVFDSKGLSGASLRAIAKAANCTTGAIYPYFKGKEEIYAEILQRSLKSLHSYIVAEAGEPSDARTRFSKFIEFYLGNPADFSLGLYLYDQGVPIGVGADLNKRLNTLLLQSVRLVAFGNIDRQGDAEDEALLLSTLMGLIITNNSRRIQLFDATIDAAASKTFGYLEAGGFPFE